MPDTSLNSPPSVASDADRLAAGILVISHFAVFN